MKNNEFLLYKKNLLYSYNWSNENNHFGMLTLFTFFLVATILAKQV